MWDLKYWPKYQVVIEDIITSYAKLKQVDPRNNLLKLIELIHEDNRPAQVQGFRQTGFPEAYPYNKDDIRSVIDAFKKYSNDLDNQIKRRRSINRNY